MGCCALPRCTKHTKEGVVHDVDDPQIIGLSCDTIQKGKGREQKSLIPSFQRALASLESSTFHTPDCDWLDAIY